MMRRTRAVRIGWVLGLTLSLAACGETPPPTPPALLDAATAQQVLDRLDRLASALEAMPRASGTPSPQMPAVAERTAVADATTELTARIAALEHELAAMRKNMGSAFAPA